MQVPIQPRLSNIIMLIQNRKTIIIPCCVVLLVNLLECIQVSRLCTCSSPGRSTKKTMRLMLRRVRLREFPSSQCVHPRICFLGKLGGAGAFMTLVAWSTLCTQISAGRFTMLRPKCGTLVVLARLLVDFLFVLALILLILVLLVFVACFDFVSFVFRSSIFSSFFDSVIIIATFVIVIVDIVILDIVIFVVVIFVFVVACLEPSPASSSDALSEPRRLCSA
mmetsp:Transcript_8123/g.15524  ORF Transcript_8123/g.15524 Transcript_8123/m.15524 type:complete len:222 (-) Transcript_8123:60-725(-)